MADGRVIIDTLLDPHGLEKGLKDLGGLAKAGSKVAIGAVGAVVTTVTGLATAATGVGMTFESSMSQVAATMGITTQEIANGSESFEMLKKAAKDAGATTQFSAGQSAEALNYLALAGYDAEKSVKALPTVLNLAAAGGLDLAYASDLVTDSMSALGLSTDELDVFVDKLAKTSQKSNTSVGQLGEAILTVGGSAKSLKGGVTELNTVLGILADNGVKGAEGGTALRNIILSLSAPTDKAADALKSLGVEAFDAEGNFRSLDDTFIDLYKGLDKLNEQEKKEVLSSIFNKVDLKSVEAMLANCGGRFDDLSGYINDSAGAAANMAATMNDNLKGKLTVIGSSLEGLGIQIYERLEGPLKTAADTAIESFSNIAENLNNGELGAGIDTIAEGLGELIAKIAKGVEEWLPKLIDAFVWIMDNSSTIVAGIIGIGTAMAVLNVVNMINGVVKSFKAWKLANEGVTVSQWLLNAAMSANPIGIIVAVIAGLIAALIYLWKTNDGFREAVIKAWEKIKEVASNVWGGICEFFTETVPEAIKNMVDWFKELPKRIGDAFTESYNKVKQWGSDTWNSITETCSNCISSVVEWFSKLPYELGYAFGRGLAIIVKWGIDSWNYLVENVPKWIESVGKWFSELPGRIWNWLVETYNKVVKWGTDTYNKMYNSAKESIDGVIKWFKEMPGKVWTWLVETVNKLITWKNDLVAKGKEAAEGLYNSVVNKVKEIPGQMVQIGKDIVSDLWKGIVSMKNWISEKIGGFFSGLFAGFKDTISGLFDGEKKPKSIGIDGTDEEVISEGNIATPLSLAKTSDGELSTTFSARTVSLVDKMRNSISYEKAKAVPSSVSSVTNKSRSYEITNNNDNGVTQNITIVSPRRSPSENRRAILKAGRELLNG